MDKRIKGNDPTPRQFVANMLPKHYKVTELITGVIRCRSAEGIESAAEWVDFLSAVKKYFGKAFKEVYHTTCTNHVNFTVYYSYTDLYNLDDTEDGGHQLKRKYTNL